VYVTSVKNVREYEITEKGAKGVKVKYLLHKGVGAKKLQFRLFTIDVGGYTPLERHAHEHEVFILRGKALIKSEEQKIIAKQGSAIFISSNEKHQFKNIGSKPLEFLCTKETID